MTHALKYGRKPPKNAPALRLSTFLSGSVPAHPVAAKHLNIGGWQLLGNDEYGDCVAVTWSNFRRLMTRLVGAEVYPGIDDVLAIYRTQNPGFPSQDDGMDIQTLLELLVKQGKILAFAKVDHTNPAEVAAAIAIFGAVWVGIDVTAANEQQFDQGKPWDYVRGSRNEGGHSILYGDYDEGTNGNEGFVTWGEETFSTDAFWTRQVEECWAVIWPENLGTAQFLEGVDVPALQAAYLAITGKVLDIPTPDPVPAPTPAPSPVDVDARLWADLKTWAAARHAGSNKTAAQALAAWAAAKSYTA